MRFVGIARPEEFRTRAHVLAWRESLRPSDENERKHRVQCGKPILSPASVRRKLSALSSLFDYLCERNAVTHNPVDGVARPDEATNEGKTPALSDPQARALLKAPTDTTLKGKRDRAILSVLLYHGLRRAELCSLRVKDLTSRRGVMYFRVHGKRERFATWKRTRVPCRLFKITWKQTVMDTLAMLPSFARFAITQLSTNEISLLLLIRFTRAS